MKAKKIKEPAKDIKEKIETLKKNFTFVFAFTRCEWAFNLTENKVTDDSVDCDQCGRKWKGPSRTVNVHKYTTFKFYQLCFCLIVGGGMQDAH